MKKIVSIITAVIILIGMMPVTASANAEFVEFEFQIYDDEAFLTKYNGYMDENVTIPETYKNYPVTYIEESVFRNNTVIKTVSIPDSVRYIGYSAFLGCTNLESVTFPENLKTIQAYAFYQCPNLKSVTLDKNVLDIYDKALGYVNDMKTGDDFVTADFKINGYTNSAAEIYAKDNEISFISVGVAPLYLYEVEELPGVEEKRARITKYLGVQKTVVVPSEIDGYTIKPVAVTVGESDESGTVLKMTLVEGRNRQIRKMCEIAGLTVKRLSRVSIGNLKLGGMPVGKWRYLDEEEIEYLKRATKNAKE